MLVVVASRGVLTLIGSGILLRLKRRAQKELVIRRARELAESGRFDGWQSVVIRFAAMHGYEGQVLALKRQQNDAGKLALFARKSKGRSGLKTERELGEIEGGRDVVSNREVVPEDERASESCLHCGINGPVWLLLDAI
jgi:hypothetical protein